MTRARLMLVALPVLIAMIASGCGSDEKPQSNPDKSQLESSKSEPIPTDAEKTQTQTPNGNKFITVTSPRPLDEVGDTLTIAGSAAVFEGTVSWHIEREGKILQRGYIQASCGGPCVGEFSQLIKLKPQIRDNNFELYVYAISQEEHGGRQHEVYVPFTVSTGAHTVE